MRRGNRKAAAWMKLNPDKPYPWFYYDVDGMCVNVNELPLNHPARRPR